MLKTSLRQLWQKGTHASVKLSTNDLQVLGCFLLGCVAINYVSQVKYKLNTILLGIDVLNSTFQLDCR